MHVKVCYCDKRLLKLKLYFTVSLHLYNYKLHIIRVTLLIPLQVENSKKHKEKVAKNRELFEKVFPELRKQREEKERFSRVGARVKSDAEMDEILDGLQEQEVRLHSF